MGGQALFNSMFLHSPSFFCNIDVRQYYNTLFLEGYDLLFKAWAMRGRELDSNGNILTKHIFEERSRIDGSIRLGNQQCAFECDMDGNYNYGDVDGFKVNSDKECQKKCQENDKCAYWTYVNNGARDCTLHNVEAPKRLGTCGKDCKRGPKYCLGLGVRLVDGKYPEVMVSDGKWSPICGHWFWNNNNGATLFCKELGFNHGIVIKRQDKPLGSDAIRVGQCLSNDKWLNCKGGFNLGICNNCDHCRAGNKASVEIKCFK